MHGGLSPQEESMGNLTGAKHLPARASAAVLLFALALLPSAAQAVQFTLTSLGAPCSVTAEVSSSCIFIDTSTTWPENQTFTVDYDFASAVGQRASKD